MGGFGGRTEGAVWAIDGMLRQCFTRMNRTFELIMSCEIGTAVAGNAVETLQMSDALNESLGAEFDQESNQAPATQQHETLRKGNQQRLS